MASFTGLIISGWYQTVVFSSKQTRWRVMFELCVMNYKNNKNLKWKGMLSNKRIDTFSKSIIETIVSCEAISNSSSAMWCSYTGHMTTFSWRSCDNSLSKNGGYGFKIDSKKGSFLLSITFWVLSNFINFKVCMKCQWWLKKHPFSWK